MSGQDVFLELAKRYFVGEQYVEAMKTLRFINDTYGPSPASDRLLGAAAQRCDDEDTAVVAYERALPHFPKDAYLRVNLAQLYLERVRPVDAARLLGEAMVLDPAIETPAGMKARLLVMKSKKRFS